MRLQDLRLLLTLAETGTLRACAERLHVTQPALTKALKQLEAELGTALFFRTAKGMRLAPAGEVLAARAMNVMRELDHAREEVASLTQSVQSTVTLGVSPAAAIVLAPGAIARLRSRWPQVKVRVVDALYPKALAQLRSGEVDLVLGPYPEQSGGQDVRVQPLLETEDVVAARAGHPLAQVERLEELAQADWILTGPRLGPGDPVQLQEHGLRSPRVVLECESFSTLLSLLPSTDALAIMPRRFFVIHGERTGHVMLPIGTPLPRLMINLIVRADGPLSLPTQRLLDMLQEEARAQRAG